MFRFIHTADLHLDSPLKALRRRNADVADAVGVATRAAFERIVTKAVDEKVDALLIAGDLYDGTTREMSTGLYLADCVRRLSGAGVHTIVLYGNHDAESVVKPPFPDSDLLTVFKTKPSTVSFENHHVAIHGASFRDAHVPDDMTPGYPDPVLGWVNIGMLHTSLGGYAAHDAYAPTTTGRLSDKGYDYWALGHVHKSDVVQDSDGGRPWIVYPGIPQGRDMGETGPKRAVLGTVHDGRVSIEWFDTAPVLLERAQVDLGDIETIDDIRGRIARIAQQVVEGAEDLIHGDARAILRLELRVPNTLVTSLRRSRDEILDLVQTNISARSDRVSLEKIGFVSAEGAAGEVGDAVNDETVAELLATVDGEAAGDTELVTAISKDFEALLSKLPADIRSDPGLLNAITDLHPERSGAVADWLSATAAESAAEIVDQSDASATDNRGRGAGP